MEARTQPSAVQPASLRAPMAGRAKGALCRLLSHGLSEISVCVHSEHPSSSTPHRLTRTPRATLHHPRRLCWLAGIPSSLTTDSDLGRQRAEFLPTSHLAPLLGEGGQQQGQFSITDQHCPGPCPYPPESAASRRAAPRPTPRSLSLYGPHTHSQYPKVLLTRGSVYVRWPHGWQTAGGKSTKVQEQGQAALKMHPE